MAEPLNFDQNLPKSMKINFLIWYLLPKSKSNFNMLNCISRSWFIRSTKLYVAIFALFYSCNSNTSISDEPMTIVSIYNLTGGQSALDIPSEQGARLAVEEINAAGGILGEQINFTVIDGQTNPTVISEEVTNILREKNSILAFTGLSDTDMLLAAAKKTAENGRFFLTSGATSPKLVFDLPEYLFLACFGDNVQAAALAEYAFHTLDKKSVSILYDTTDTYTQLLQDYFLSRFEELGGQLNSRVPYNDQSLLSAVSNLESADMIFFASLPQNVQEGIEWIREAGLNVPILGGDSFDGQEFWDTLSSGEVYFATHAYIESDNPDQFVRDFIKVYTDRYPQSHPTAFSALGYDAIKILASAIEQSGDSSPENIGQALFEMTPYKGITGTIRYANGQRIPLKTVSILSSVEGSFGLAAELIPEKVPNP